ncbi:2-oxo acid dehydrogenase subunit E2 [Roseibacterium sp. SDUM158016]|uniref:2-oxo acid dehydrogenase subunit E2 n=1 Tax=Roseicyclus sediminis TaxID=2980997 RepID=UPI0021D32B6B|nr:2-oxo acid dehydrogenase subunit E2 [Roseibacterium sp. SDUM158016]MCU4652088.1 2-oxo acid dehydrogenase subunit E2 [Roseibacterium sp. SDUM158016]
MARIHPITLPKWGLEMSEGTVSAWHVAEGDIAERGSDLVDIETDKIVNTVELDVSGRIRRILVASGEIAPVGALMAVLADDSVPEAEVDAFIAGFTPVDAGFEPGSDTASAPTAAPAGTAPVEAAEAVSATPLARRLARDHGLDLSELTGSGSRGRITRDDVLAAAGRPAALSPAEAAARNAQVHASPIARKFANSAGLDLTGVPGTGRKGRVSLGDAQAAAERDGLWRPAPKAPRPSATAPGAAVTGVQPFTSMRKAIARSVSASKRDVPHFYTAMPIRIDALNALRADLKAAPAAPGVKITVNDFFLRACAVALERCPDLNVHVTEDGVRRFDQVDLCLAVSVDGGLLAPVLRDAGRKSVTAIARETADLVAAARARTLAAEALEGGTFTLSNLGMYGVASFDAIITPPQGAILALGGPQERAARAPGGGICFETVVMATLSADHRAIDGAMAAEFLAVLRDLVETPIALLN